MPRSLWDRVQAQLNNNLRKRWNRVRERASSLLTGLVENEQGNRYTPSFTVRRGRRYRYYVSQLAIKNRANEAMGPTRVPAQELESRVIEKLLALGKAYRSGGSVLFDVARSKATAAWARWCPSPTIMANRSPSS